MISILDQTNLLVQIGNNLSRKVICYAIGGTAMMFLGFKEATKDIDLVFTTKDDRALFKEVAKSLGYKEMDSVIVYGVRNNRPEMIDLGDSRLDLFFLDVIDFTFSEKMQQRAIQIHEFGKNLTLKIADKHDIILMKCVMNRTKDEDDIVNIIKKDDINWDILIEESKVQVSLGRDCAYLYMGDLTEKLVNVHHLNVDKKIPDTFFNLLEEQAKTKKESLK